MACFQAIQLDDDQSLRVYVQVSRQTDASLGDPHLNERVILRRQHQHLICRRPIDIDAYDDQGYTMIMRATQAEAVQCIQALVNLGSNVNAYANVMRQMNYDPSVRLRRKGLQHEQTPEMVQATSSGTANSFDAQDQTKATEHSFKQNSNTKVHDDVKALRDDPNVDGDDLFLDGPLGCTALSLSTLASTRSAREVTRLLLEAKADVTQPQYDGKTALHIAAMSGALDGLAMLVEADGTPDYALHCVDSAGNSPLLLAAQKNHTNVIAYLGMCLRTPVFDFLPHCVDQHAFVLDSMCMLSACRESSRNKATSGGSLRAHSARLETFAPLAPASSKQQPKWSASCWWWVRSDDHG